jgi:hypothetical protein
MGGGQHHGARGGIPAWMEQQGHVRMRGTSGKMKIWFERDELCGVNSQGRS